jgi:hypothetical protein
LSDVVAAEAGYAGAQPALIEARRQVELMANVQQRLSAPHRRAPWPVPLILGMLAVAVLAATVAGRWHDSATVAPAVAGSQTAVAAGPSPTQIVIVYVSPPGAMPTPTPALGLNWLDLGNSGSATAAAGSGAWEAGAQRASGSPSSRGAIDTSARQNSWSVVADPVSPAVVYAGSPLGGVFRSNDSGQTWRQVGGMQVSSMVADQITGDIYTVGGDGVWRSSNKGEMWTSLGLEGAGVVTLMLAQRPAGAREPATLFAATATRGVFASYDGGRSWSLLEDQPAPDRR